jgi:hypothetical protein
MATPSSALGLGDPNLALAIPTPNLQRTRRETTQASSVNGKDWSEAYFDGLGRTY